MKTVMGNTLLLTFYKSLVTIESYNNNVLFTDNAVIPRFACPDVIGDRGNQRKNLKHGFPIKPFGNDEKSGYYLYVSYLLLLLITDYPLPFFRL